MKSKSQLEALMGKVIVCSVRLGRLGPSGGARAEENPKPAEGPIADELRRELMLHLQRAGRVPWQP